MKCVVIGGGAAGFFAAVRCAENGGDVVLLEKGGQVLGKVRISGGGRCNVTHACFDVKELVKRYPRGERELLGPFSRFQPRDTIAWFEKRGVELKTEEDGRMFPVTDSSETIIDALMKAAEDAGVQLIRKVKIASVEKVGEKFQIETSEGVYEADRLIVTTGSAPWGHKLAEKFGHTIVKPVPSLFTFNVPTSPLLDLSGISVQDAELSLKSCKLRERGPLLLTHWGFSGPAALKLSAWGARKLFDLNYQTTLTINWLPEKSEQDLYDYFLQCKKREPQKKLAPLLPTKLFERLMEKCSLDPKAPARNFKGKALARFAATLHADTYPVEGKTTYKQEFVTAGGIDLKEIDFKTMESKLCPGLHFAGEILNIDGITGGFNFQNAWTTAYLAGS